jgi:hypothetical protein
MTAEPQLVEALNALAYVLIEAAKPKRTKRLLTVAAFGHIAANGKPRNPVPISEGDDVYVARLSQPGTGTISADPSGSRFGRALEAVAAGRVATVGVSVYLKRWVTNGDPCPTCDENALAGYIGMDESFPSGDDEPEAHPNCRCDMIVHSGDEE